MPIGTSACIYKQLGVQSCCRLVINLKLLTQPLRKLLQPRSDDAEGHGDARLDRVAQPAEEDAHNVPVQRLVDHRLSVRHPRQRLKVGLLAAQVGISHSQLARQLEEGGPHCRSGLLRPRPRAARVCAKVAVRRYAVDEWRAQPPHARVRNRRGVCGY